jgi:hypothetical protein
MAFGCTPGEFTMAYLDIDNMFAAPVAHRTARSNAAAGTVEAAGFSPIEWSVIAVSRHDSLTSLDGPGRVSRAFGSLFGFGTKSRLADSRLEALRRLAVHAWRRGYALPQAEVDQFLDAGFTLSQAETLVASVTGEHVGTFNSRIAA